MIKKIMLFFILIPIVLAADFYFKVVRDSSVKIPKNFDGGIVVLTGGSARIQTALSIFAKGTGDRLLITGVSRGVTLDEIISRSNQEKGDAQLDFTPQRQELISLDYRAKDTKGNADETSKWVKRNKLDSLIIITSNYHIKRSMLEYERELPGVKLYPISVRPNILGRKNWWESKKLMRLYGEEYLKYYAVLFHITSD